MCHCFHLGECDDLELLLVLAEWIVRRRISKEPAGKSWYRQGSYIGLEGVP